MLLKHGVCVNSSLWVTYEYGIDGKSDEGQGGQSTAQAGVDQAC